MALTRAPADCGSHPIGAARCRPFWIRQKYLPGARQIGGAARGDQGSAPRRLRSWAETNFQDFRSFFETWSGTEAADIQFHYDTTRAYRARWSSYFHDPRLHAVARAGTVVVVTLKPTRAQLCEQFGSRAFGDETPAQTRGAMQLAELPTLRDPALPDPSGADNELQTPDEPLSKLKRRPLSPAEVVACYQTQGWLETWFQHWDDLVAHLARCGPLTKEVLVAPTGHPYDGGERRWTLLKVRVPRRVKFASWLTTS